MFKQQCTKRLSEQMSVTDGKSHLRMSTILAFLNSFSLHVVPRAFVLLGRQMCPKKNHYTLMFFFSAFVFIEKKILKNLKQRARHFVLFVVNNQLDRVTTRRLLPMVSTLFQTSSFLGPRGTQPSRSTVPLGKPENFPKEALVNSCMNIRTCSDSEFLRKFSNSK